MTEKLMRYTIPLLYLIFLTPPSLSDDPANCDNSLGTCGDCPEGHITSVTTALFTHPDKATETYYSDDTKDDDLYGPYVTADNFTQKWWVFHSDGTHTTTPAFDPSPLNIGSNRVALYQKRNYPIPAPPAVGSCRNDSKLANVPPPEATDYGMNISNWQINNIIPGGETLAWAGEHYPSTTTCDPHWGDEFFHILTHPTIPKSFFHGLAINEDFSVPDNPSNPVGVITKQEILANDIENRWNGTWIIDSNGWRNGNDNHALPPGSTPWSKLAVNQTVTFTQNMKVDGDPVPISYFASHPLVFKRATISGKAGFWVTKAGWGHAASECN